MAEPDSAPARTKDPVASIAAQLRDSGTDTGLVTALRRHHPVAERRRCLFELHQVLDRAGVIEGSESPRFDRWALLVHCLALARGAHRPDVGCGAVLAQAHLSEARVRQLVEADAAMLFDLLPLLARRLAAGGWTLNWWPLARLALNADLDEDRADAARSEIVRGWLRGTNADPSGPAADANAST